MTTAIDLDFRPNTYFRPQKLEKYLLTKVKGAVLKKKIQVLFSEGRHSEVSELLGTEGISTNDRKVLEAFHPMFMGGNYLPDTEDGEVEIARIRISSTTYDVTSVYAKRDEGVIRYRVVDEYDGDTLTEPTEMVSDKTLSLGDLADFFLNAWSLIDVLEMNFEGDLDGSLNFFSAESDFYPDFDHLCRQRVVEKFPESPGSDEDGTDGRGS